MKRTPTLSIACAAFAALLASPSAMAQQTIPASSPDIQYMGRVARSGDSVQLAYSGIETRVAFTGPSLTIRGVVHGQAAYFNASIDGVDLPRVDLASGPFEYTFKHYLPAALPHTLRLVRRNESWHGIVEIASFQTGEGGSVLPSPPPLARKILSIGDSITVGEKVDLIPPETVGFHTWNAERGYPWLIAKDFEAQINIVAYGGRGLIRDWQGLETSTTAPQFFERTLPDDASSAWDHAAYQPDLVTICLGTNDFSQGIPERAKFVEAYIRFVDRIHAVHPEAKVLIISGPWFGEGDPKRAALNAYIDAVVAHYGERGTSFVNRHFFSGTYPGSELDAHPHALQHRAMATDIGQTINQWLGW